MRKSTIFLFCVIFFVVSCDLPLENNQRATYKLKIEDEKGNPLNGIKVDIAVYSDNFGNSFPAVDFRGIIGSDRSNEQGNVSVLSLVPEFGSQLLIYVIINGSDRFSLLSYNTNAYANETYGLVAYEVLLEAGRNVTLPAIQLKPRADFELNLNRNSETLDTLQYKVTFERPSQIYQLNGEQSLIKDQLSETLTNTVENLSATRSISTLQGSTVFFTSQFINKGISAPVTIEIPVNSNQVSYDFEY